MNTLRSLSIIFGLLLTTSVYAMDFGRCNDLFPNKRAPEVSNSLINTKGPLKPLCFSDFAVLYSSQTKGAVYSVERLSYLTANIKVKRTNRFHEEPMLNKSERATLREYTHSGWDKGHLSPAADRVSDVGMTESTSLSNVLPQAPKFNRGIWAKSVEGALRKYVKRSAGDIFVFTGGYYTPEHKVLGNGIWIPDYFFKLVFDNQSKRSWVYFLANRDDVRMTAPITYQEFVAKTGLHLLD
jgi:endonuclease G